MDIALIGYGKMGKEIEKVALERGHSIVQKIDNTNLNEFTKENLQKADVAIEFTVPSSVLKNIFKCFEFSIPVVTGTTGWYEHFEAVKKECKEKDGTLFYASNFSLGVNIFFKLNSFLAKIMNNYPDYKVSLEEIHHTQKLDEPSGTAITLANEIIKNIESKKDWSLTVDRDNIVPIKSIRKNPYPGTHCINYDSTIDSIEIKHEAKNRKGFALGAVLAAEYTKEKKGVLTMDDMLSF